MNESGDISKNRKKDIDPEVHTEAHFEKDSEWRDQHGKYNSYNVSHSFFSGFRGMFTLPVSGCFRELSRDQ